VEDHEQRRRRLITEHGEPRPVKAAVPLELLGRRAEVHPRDAVAFAYRDLGAAAAWTETTREHYGIPSLGIVTVDGAIVGVYDLRAALAANGAGATSPRLPDNWTPPHPARRLA
jgi:hypothetical protein